mgnify:CR=1 FL=1
MQEHNPIPSYDFRVDLGVGKEHCGLGVLQKVPKFNHPTMTPGRIANTIENF